MNEQKQKLLLEYLISSPDTFAICVPIVRSEYFDPGLRNAVDFILKYYKTYNTIPSPTQIVAETSTELRSQAVTPDQVEYCAAEVEGFCKHRAIEKAILELASLSNKQDYGKMENIFKDAVTVSLNRNMGLDYFDDPEKRLQRALLTQARISTGYSVIDEKLFGGLARKELFLVTANTGGGKSLTMANLGLNLVLGGLNVLYVSLEMSEDILAQRFDSMTSGISSAIWQHHISEIAHKVKHVGQNSGKLSIIQMLSGTNANQMRAYIREYNLHYGRLPDVLIVDYIDIMGTNESVSADNVFEKDKRASEQIRNLGVEYNMIVISASQQNRSAVGATDINQSHIAGGISKANTTDVWVSAIFTDKMKAEGKIAYQFLKTRNSDGVGKTVYLNFDAKSLRITNEPNHDGLPTLKRKGCLTDDTDLAPPAGGILDFIQV